MELIQSFIDIVLHLDKHLAEIIQAYGLWTYMILFTIIFCETGLVILPLLPGDSLLFAAGSMAAAGALNLHTLFILLSAAAILGDTVNYWIGWFIGPKIFHEEKARFFKKEHLIRTQHFYEKHGGKTIILARFIPIIRTFAPFVAGIGQMNYGKFLLYNVTGGIVWILLFLYGGYFFGNLPFVKQNFSLVILAIIIISVIPAVVEYFRAKAVAVSE